jgi:hypothetical protein
MVASVRVWSHTERIQTIHTGELPLKTDPGNDTLANRIQDYKIQD